MGRPVRISRSDYRDKVFACWLGKNIGGTLGAPYECKKQVNDLDYFDPVPSTSAPNDDLDFQLVWLRCLEERGIETTCGDLADYWVRYLSAYPWNEYGFCRRNLGRGLRPPVSGCFENYYVDEMGSPIRSELWACVAPGDPQLAAALAWHDAVLDHAGGEGLWGEMFWAAVQSAAFVLDDPRTLIRIGLAMIPIHSQIHRVVRHALWCRDHDVPWLEARQQILDAFGHHNPCHAPQNHGFTILGWLYGQDFGDRLCKAVNCGYDTDCTGATLGALLGILGGTAAIPARWREPVGEEIVLHKFTGPCEPPATIAELTERTAAVAEPMVAERSDAAEFADATAVPDDLSVFFRNERALRAARRDPTSAIERTDGLDLALHYLGEPVIRPGIEKMIAVSVTRDDAPCAVTRVEVQAPDGWRVEPVHVEAGRWHLRLRAGDVAERNELRVTAVMKTASPSAAFTILGPTGDYPANVNVPRCPKCNGRAGSCLCGEAGEGGV